MKYLLVLFVSFSAFAQTWMVDTDTALSNAQTSGVRSYPTLKRCQQANPAKTCVDAEGHNLRFERFSGGVWVEDAPSKTSYTTEQTNKATKAANKAARRSRLVTGAADAAAANSVPALRGIVADLVNDLNDLTGNQ